MNDLQKKLEDLKDLKQRSVKVYDSNVWQLGHDLAEARYPPAKDYFVSGLQDTNWGWRQDCISFLGFHYSLDDEILDQIRELALTDSYSDVRISAVSVLGSQSSLPDHALLSALVSDPNNIVRKAAFEAILKLFGVTYKAINRELGRINAKETQPTIELVKQVLKQEKIQYTHDKLGS